MVSGRSDRVRLESMVAVGMLIMTAIFAVPSIDAQTVPDGFGIEVVHPKPGVKALGFALLPDDRILVIGHQTGEIRLLVDGEMREDPVATIPNLVWSSERGLLGIAVDPDFPDSSYVYLFYTHAGVYNRVSRFRVDGAVTDGTSDDLSIDLLTERVLMELPDESPIHNGGTLRFGSDKTLYISHGDDQKWKEDQQPYMQDLTNPYGKILRIHRNGTAPDDNPSFPNEPPDRLPEIFAIGLRNPFRFAIDPHTDALFIGDVGTNIREEFNLSTGGENFGYPRHEGSTFFKETYALIDPEPTPPIYDYVYDSQDSRSAMALVTYRGVDRPRDSSFPASFDGVHFYADFFGKNLRYLRPDSSGGWESVSFGSGFDRLTDAAIGPDGSMYVIRYDGPLRRIYFQNANVGVDDAPISAPFELRQNYPNPFDHSTTITYRLDAADHVRLEVFDLLGRRLATLVDAWQPTGVHAARFRAGGLAPGTYVYRLVTSGATQTRSMIILPNAD